MPPKGDDAFTIKLLMAIIQTAGVKTSKQTYDTFAKDLGTEVTSDALRKKVDRLKKQYPYGSDAEGDDKSPAKKATPASKKRKASKKGAAKEEDDDEETPSKKAKTMMDAVEGDEDGDTN